MGLLRNTYCSLCFKMYFLLINFRIKNVCTLLIKLGIAFSVNAENTPEKSKQINLISFKNTRTIMNYVVCVLSWECSSLLMYLLPCNRKKTLSSNKEFLDQYRWKAIFLWSTFQSMDYSKISVQSLFIFFTIVHWSTIRFRWSPILRLAQELI